MTASQEPSLRRAVLLTTAASVLVPLAGLASAPLLAHGLGVAGRGTVTAAGAPNTLIVGTATLGLPEALTFFLAKYPSITRRGLAWSTLVGTLLGLVCILIVISVEPFLSAGDPTIGALILIATWIAIPSLIIDMFRGAAAGRQMWGTIAVERVTSSVLRIAALAAFLVAGQLTVLSALLISTIAPVIGGLAYLRLLRKPPLGLDLEPFDRSVPKTLVGFGSRIWIGAVAQIFLARIGQVIFAPLSSVEQLGLLMVAVTISDVPLIVSLAIRDALYGVNSRSADAEQVAQTTRVTVLLAFAGSVVIGVTLPYWIGFAFGTGFEASIVPTWVLLASSVISIPGFLAAAGIGAWGRPGTRSLGLAFTTVINLALFLLLVPHFGALGSAIASVGSSLFQSSYMVVAAARILQLKRSAFLLPRRRDFGLLWHEAVTLSKTLRRKR